MATLKGFWSYAHNDDEADHGRIVQLARDVTEEYEMQTGDTISLFLDQDNIDWGKIWRHEIDSSLSSTGFFVPILTPRYFLRPECRRELQSFVRTAKDLGFKDLILPLHYIDVPSFYDETNTDELILLIKKYQWLDWRDLRFSESTSEKYRRGVANIAAKLVLANKKFEEESAIDTNLIESKNPSQPRIDNIPEKAEEIQEPDPIELIEGSSKKLNEVPAVLNQIAAEMQVVNKVLNEEADWLSNLPRKQLNLRSKKASTNRILDKLRPTVENIWKLSNQLSNLLNGVDNGYRLIFEYIPALIAVQPESKKNICVFYNSIREMIKVAKDAFKSMTIMHDMLDVLQEAARDLRPLTRRLQQGLAVIVESDLLFDEWLSLINSSGVICEDQSLKMP